MILSTLDKILDKMIGRRDEVKELGLLMTAREAEFLAITGRRRVGKTYLINEFFKDSICFQFTGLQDGEVGQQLANFTVKLLEYDEEAKGTVPENWIWAFAELKKYLKKLPSDRKQVIFIDELPWIGTSSSNFVQVLAHFWNDFLSKHSHYILIICGSATSWIVNNILGDPGGMHNRVTKHLHLRPFTLAETKAFLELEGHRLNNIEIAKIYMALGGIPYYLKNLKVGDNFATGMDDLAFKRSGSLSREYENLYAALFKNAEVHEAVVANLAKYRQGMSREELATAINISSGSRFKRIMDELIESDFVAADFPFGAKRKGKLYRLVDEFSIFYHRFIQPMQTYTPNYWQLQSSLPKFKIWTGFAFENMCRKHVGQIKEVLRIGAVYAPVSTLRIPASEEESGCQIDLILDRNDNTVNLCEMKFHNDEFVISKEYHQKLLHKKRRFEVHTKTKKQVFITMVTNHPVKRNKWFHGTVDSVVLLDDLFDVKVI